MSHVQFGQLAACATACVAIAACQSGARPETGTSAAAVAVAPGAVAPAAAADLDKLVAARVGVVLEKRLVELKLAKSPTQLAAEKSAEAAMPAHAQSQAFLARLDELMKDYTPALAEPVDNTDLMRCTTKDEAATNPELAKAAAKLQGQRKASERERAGQAAAFERGKWVQYRLDYGWKGRVANRPKTFGCWDIHNYWNGEEKHECYRANGGTSKVHTTEVVRLYTGVPVTLPGAFVPPELMRRVEAATLTVPERFACEVVQVSATTTGKRIACTEAGSAVYLHITGAMAVLHIGDIVSVPLRDSNRDPNGVLAKEPRGRDGPTWVVDADGATVKVDNAAKCPAVAEIVAATAVPAKEAK